MHWPEAQVDTSDSSIAIRCVYIERTYVAGDIKCTPAMTNRRPHTHSLQYFTLNGQGGHAVITHRRQTALEAERATSIN